VPGVQEESTLNLRLAETGESHIGGYVQDTNNLSKAIDLPEINPLTFDEEEYRQLLPTMLAYAAKYQQIDPDLGTAKQFTTSTGLLQDYLYKRYVFDNLDWDFTNTNISYEGGTAYVKLTYSNTPSVPQASGVILKGKDAARVSIQVPVRVKNCVAERIDKISSRFYTNVMYEQGQNMVVALSSEPYTTYFASIVDDANINYGKVLSEENEYPTALASSYGNVLQYKGVSGTITKVSYEQGNGRL
jgi:hypothetical protein